MTSAARDKIEGNLIYRANLRGSPAILSYGEHFIVARFDRITNTVTINSTKYRGPDGNGLVWPMRTSRVPYSMSTEGHKRAVERALRNWDVKIVHQEDLQ